MKNFVKTMVLLTLVAMAVSCSGTSKTSGEQTLSAAFAVVDFAGIQGKDWNLAEIRTGQKQIAINRAAWTEEGFGEFFTLHFDAERVSGAGAPNRYFAPYSLSADNAISIGMIAGTLMAAFREPEEIKEHEFFALLQKANKWNLAGENLELYTEKEDGTETVLVFK
jgi:heat shock protein HslJ